MNLRKWLFILPLFIVGSLFAANTYTTRAGIPKPADADTDWGTTLRSSFDVIDSSMAILGGVNNYSGTNNFKGVNVSSGNALSLYNTLGNALAYLQNAGGTGNSEINIVALDGIGLNNSALGSYADLIIYGGNASPGYGRFAVEGSSANASFAYSGFIATSPIDSSTLWSLPKKDGTANQPLVTDGSAHLSFTSTLSSTTFVGGIGLWNLPIASINALIPSTTGQQVWCNDCTSNGAKGTPCYSTGSVTTFQFVLSTGTACK